MGQLCAGVSPLRCHQRLISLGLEAEAYRRLVALLVAAKPAMSLPKIGASNTECCQNLISLGLEGESYSIRSDLIPEASASARSWKGGLPSGPSPSDRPQQAVRADAEGEGHGGEQGPTLGLSPTQP